MSHAHVNVSLNRTVLTRESVAKSIGGRIAEDKVDILFDEEHPHFPIDLRNTKMFMIIIFLFCWILLWIENVCDNLMFVFDCVSNKKLNENFTVPLKWKLRFNVVNMIESKSKLIVTLVRSGNTTWLWKLIKHTKKWIVNLRNDFIVSLMV